MFVAGATARGAGGGLRADAGGLRAREMRRRARRLEIVGELRGGEHGEEEREGRADDDARRHAELPPVDGLDGDLQLVTELVERLAEGDLRCSGARP